MEVRVGLFTADGEVSAEGYARVPSQLRVDDSGVHVNGVEFPPATANWGTVMTAGIFTAEGEPICYFDMSAPMTMQSGDTYNINEINAHIDE